MIIGITGWFASGKDTAAEYLRDEKKFISVSLSDFIRDALRAEGKELSRDNLRDMGNKLREKFGADHLAKKALEAIESDPSQNYVVPSVRTLAELNILKEESGFSLWEINVPAKVRYDRLLERARTEDEKKITFEDFTAKEKVETSTDKNKQQVDQVIAKADKVIDNSGTLEDLYQNIDEAIEGK